MAVQTWPKWVLASNYTFDKFNGHHSVYFRDFVVVDENVEVGECSADQFHSIYDVSFWRNTQGMIW
jgi:hypothetical protein